MSGCGHQFSWEKTFAVSLQTMKFVKVFSLESFLLYSIVIVANERYSDDV